MLYIVCMCLFGLILGLAAVASNPSPYFAALGLVVVAAAGCGVLASYGASFLSLILFLIYLGGMLVVFAYSAALAAEPYPESWGGGAVFSSVLFYAFLVGAAGLIAWEGGYLEMLEVAGEITEVYVLRGDTSGVGLIYSCGGWLLVLGGLVLLVTLFVVLEITRGLSRGVTRVI
uniref:NADH-ubiquinone oxidoreductase chain 6 n=1 Tax=Scriptaphyosemion schmitti TaxID=60408 RepID=A0A517Y3R8_9TELE|nr:NADH dehydrogenase subunit 6 [Scriptaphyosemion schmitti]QDU24436.1 NADH dehydrogenase subunit 6 [Scriptaphyosemion schmitti]